MNNIKETVISFYLNWLGNCHSVASMAHHYNMTTDECQQLIELGRKWHTESLDEELRIITAICKPSLP